MNLPILRTLAGSRAYGLETPESDWDFHEVFVVPTSDLLALGEDVKRTRWEENREGVDTQAWELGHFLSLATKCNPTILETFIAPEVYNDETLAQPGEVRGPLATELRALLPHVLSRRLVRDAFRGYAHNQRAKLFNKPDDPTEYQLSERAWKFAAQYLRVLIVGERLLRTGELVIDMGKYEHGLGPTKVALLKGIRAGYLSLGTVIDGAKWWEDELELAYQGSAIPEEPSLKPVNDFLLRMRRSHW